MPARRQPPVDVMPWEMTADGFMGMFASSDWRDHSAAERVIQASFRSSIHARMPWSIDEDVRALAQGPEIRVLVDMPAERGGHCILPFDIVWLADDRRRLPRAWNPVEVACSPADLVLLPYDMVWCFVPANLDCSRCGAHITAHGSLVRAALASGRPVPDRVLAGYPGLREIVVPPFDDPRPTHAMTGVQRIHARRGLYWRWPDRTTWLRVHHPPWTRQPLDETRMGTAFAPGRPEFLQRSVPPVRYAALFLDPYGPAGRTEGYASWVAAWYTGVGNQVRSLAEGRGDWWRGRMVLAAEAMGAGDYERMVHLVRQLDPALVGGVPRLDDHYYRAGIRPGARILHWYGIAGGAFGQPLDPPPWYGEMIAWLRRLPGSGDWRAHGKPVLDNPLDDMDMVDLFDDLALEYASTHGYDAVELLPDRIAVLNPAVVDPLVPVGRHPRDDVVPYRVVVDNERSSGLEQPDDVPIEVGLGEPDMARSAGLMAAVMRAVDMLQRAVDGPLPTTARGDVQVACQVVDVCRLLLVRLAHLGRAIGSSQGRRCARCAKMLRMPGPGAVGRQRAPGFEAWSDAELDMSMAWHEQAARSRAKRMPETSIVVRDEIVHAARQIERCLSATDDARGRPDLSAFDTETYLIVAGIIGLMQSDRIRWPPGTWSINRELSLVWGL